MDSCFSSKTSTLRSENNKAKFREKCQDLANYLIQNNNPPRYYEQYKVTWKGALNFWLKVYYRDLNKYGGCPLILEEKDKTILNLKYEEVDFCDKKKKDLEEIKQLSGKSKGTDIYISKCNAYNEWIEQKWKHFEQKQNLFETCYKKTSLKKKKKGSSDFICDLMNPQTFQKIPDCPSPNTLSSLNVEAKKAEKVLETKDKEKQEDSKESNDPPELASPAKSEEIDQDTNHNQHEQTNQQVPSTQHDLQIQERLSSPEPPPEEDKADFQSSSQSKTLTLPKPSKSSLEVSGESLSPSPVPLVTKPDNAPQATLSSTISSSQSSPLVSPMPSYTLLGILKKKKRIKKRQVKFLRILLPSLSNRSEHLTQGHLEHPEYDAEEIIKNINIYECNTIKKVNALNRKNERTKTIIEVHLEVLKEYRKEEWEYRKGEFLDICLEVLTKEGHRTNPSLTNEELTIESIKNSNDTVKNKILWIKWIERHKNISEKLKKVEWFNNLKNEWKKEKSYIKEMKELKNESSNENHNILLLEREKDIWRKWISKKRKFIEQYFEQDWFKELAEEYQNMLDEYTNEEKVNDELPKNIEKMEHRENYEELYKYIRTKLLSKFCILAYMAILEECKKEDYIENRELHLDSSINDWKNEENSEKKIKITDNFIEKNNNVYENSKNKEIHNNIGENLLGEKLEDWIGEDESYVNSI
ncbi:STP1 protein [Plasmodium malariae]|uniref:STP1 protein n=1 Tax=Plasmodium malariae TaxID=5858 RepID=A0A1D3JL13_PLAMA|nr:STP1 protein [Plasmodium malariae]SBT87275.1 STP1 protein [Plasmodium malariae]